MFCGKCGAQNSNEAVFCKECGTKIDCIQQDYTPVRQAKKHRFPIGKIIAILLAFFLTIGGLYLFGGRGYERTVQQFIDASIDGDAKMMLRLLPNAVIEYGLEEDGYKSSDRDIAEEEIEEMLWDQLAQLDNYDWRMTYEIRGSEELTKKDLRNLQREYTEIDMTIKKARTVTVDLSIWVNGEKTVKTVEINVIKVGPSWYLDMASMGSIF